MTETIRIADPLIAEMDMEAEATRRLLELVPGDKLTWKPHAKSMTLGQLALHIAGVPGISGFVEIDEMDANNVKFEAPQPESQAEILKAFNENLEAARTRLGALDNAVAEQPWRLHKGGVEIFTVPKSGLLRSLMMNHLYHHRGQLTVYLRLLDVPLPVVYGRTADVDPFVG